MNTNARSDKLRFGTLMQFLLIAIFILVAELHALGANNTPESSPPCPNNDTPAGWKTYVNKKYRFCFSYPPIYRPVSKPWLLNKYADTADYSRYLQKAAEGGRLFRLDNTQTADAPILVHLETDPFDLQSLVKSAPTGQESPPEPRSFGGQAFYYYGPGGGGVCYPDQFFYNLNGKTLSIGFAGPCVGDKTPTPEIKEIEKKLLTTFRMF